MTPHERVNRFALDRFPDIDPVDAGDEYLEAKEVQEEARRDFADEIDKALRYTEMCEVANRVNKRFDSIISSLECLCEDGFTCSNHDDELLIAKLFALLKEAD